jgi:hypothetical protein
MTNMTTPNRLPRRGRRIAAATGILAPLGLLAGIGNASAAGATTPPVPAGYTSVTDITGLLTINVPAEWTATDLNPIDGEPSIWATTDMEQYQEGIGVPGVSFDAVVQQEADTGTRLTAFMSEYGIDEGDCDVAEGPEPQTTYEGTGHGALEGSRILYDCGGASVMGFVGIAADGTGVEVFLQLPQGEDPGIADQIMGTFTYLDLSTLATGTVPGGSGVPGSVAPAPASTVPAVPVPTVTPAPVPAPVTTVPAPAPAPAPAPSSVPATTVAGGSVAPGSLAGQVPLTEDTGRLTIQVPAEWTDTNMIPLGETPSIWASTDLTAFGDGLATSGVEFDVSTLVVDPTSYVISQIEFAGVDLTQCTEVAPVAAWTSPQTGAGVYTGAIVKYDCAGTLITSAVGVSADGTTELDILIKLAPGDDPAIADNILATFTLA